MGSLKKLHRQEKAEMKQKAKENKHRIIHLGTRVEAVFAVCDENGNAPQKVPVRVEVASLDPQNWNQALQAILGQRQQLAQQGDIQAAAEKIVAEKNSMTPAHSKNDEGESKSGNGAVH